MAEYKIVYPTDDEPEDKIDIENLQPMKLTLVMKLILGFMQVYIYFMLVAFIWYLYHRIK